MKIAFPTRLLLTVAGILFAGLLGAYWAAGESEWLAIGLSLASLAVAVLGAFRNELFPFAPVLLGGDVLLAPAHPPSATFSCVLPLQIVNEGYGEGIVEWIAVRLKAPGLETPISLGPIVEVDIQKFLQGRRHLHAENILGPFAPFRLKGKEAAVKAILFTREETPDSKPVQINAGEWHFELFAKVGGKKKPLRLLEFSRGIQQNILDQYVSGGGSHLMGRDILLP